MGLFGFGKKKEAKKELTPEEEYEEKNKVALNLMRSYGLDPYSFTPEARNNLVFLFNEIKKEDSCGIDGLLNGNGDFSGIQSQGVIRNVIAVLNTAQNYKLQESINELNNNIIYAINLLQSSVQTQSKEQTTKNTSKEEKTLKIDSRTSSTENK